MGCNSCHVIRRKDSFCKKKKKKKKKKKTQKNKKKKNKKKKYKKKKKKKKKKNTPGNKRIKNQEENVFKCIKIAPSDVDNSSLDAFCIDGYGF